MLVFYHCYGSAHSSILAASIHLGFATGNNINYKKIQKLPCFDLMLNGSVGIPIYYGTDNKGNQIFAFGTKSAGTSLIKTLASIYKEVGVVDTIVFVDTLHLINLWTRLGGFLSRQLGIICVGRPLAAWGLWVEFDNFVNLVNRVKEIASGNLDSCKDLPDNES